MLVLGAESDHSSSADLVDERLQRVRSVVVGTMRDARSDTAVLLHTMRAPSSCPPGVAPVRPGSSVCLVACSVVESPPNSPNLAGSMRHGHETTAFKNSTLSVLARNRVSHHDHVRPPPGGAPGRKIEIRAVWRSGEGAVRTLVAPRGWWAARRQCASRAESFRDGALRLYRYRVDVQSGVGRSVRSGVRRLRASAAVVPPGLTFVPSA